MKRSNKENCTFPLFGKNQILEKLKSLKIDASIVLDKPNANNVREIYFQLLAKVVIIEDCSHLEYSEMISIYVANCRKVFSVAGIRDFSVSKDLEKPTKERVLYILNGLVNYIKFCNGLKECDSKYESEISEGKKDIKSIEEQTEKCAKEKETALYERIKETMEIKMLNKVITEKKAEILPIRNKVNNLKEKINEHKTAKEIVKQSNERKKKHLYELGQQFTFLRDQVVDPQENIESNIEALREQTKQQKDKFDLRSRQINEFREYENMSNRLFKKTNKRINECKKITQILETVKNFKKDVKELTKKIGEEESKIKIFNEKKKFLDNCIDIEKQNHSEMEERVKKKRLELDSEKEKLSKTQTTRQRKQRDVREKADYIRKEIDQIEAQTTKITLEEQKLLEEAEEEMKLFENWSENFCNEVEGLFGDISMREEEWLSEEVQTDQN